MLNSLYALQAKYKNRKIYIWNLNRNSIVVFTKVLFMGVDICGFATMREEHAGELYMNRPVVTLKQIEDDKDTLILMDDQVPKSIVDMLPDDRSVYWKDALEINETLRHRKIIVYGTGFGAEQLSEVLEEAGLEPTLYCVTSFPFPPKCVGGGVERSKSIAYAHKGKTVISVAQLEKYIDCALIISVIKEKYRKEILETLSDFQGQVYVEHVISNYSIGEINLIPNIDFAIKNKCSIYFYSKRNLLADLAEKILAIYGVGVSGYVYETENEKEGIKSIFDLAYDGIENKLIIMNEELPESLVRARETIELAGFSMEGRNYTGFQDYGDSTALILSKVKESYDPLVGGSILYSPGKPGWKVYGNGEGTKILVLGGSTSSEVLHPENWVSKFYYKLRRNHFEVTVYNGAHVCNDITTEILRLLRDGSVLRPHIVISMSGVNNLRCKKSTNQFHEERVVGWVHTLSADGKFCSGLYNEESLYSFWHRNLRLLRLIAEFYGVEFFGFLQPINITMKDMTLWEQGIYEEEKNVTGAKDFAEGANAGEDYYNLMSLFEHQNEMYFDMCHYTDKGNEILAEKVYETILPLLKI